MRKVFLDDLPRWESGRYKGKIKWKDVVGREVKFTYDEIEGTFTIFSYANNYLTFYYKQQDFTMSTSHFRQCKFKALLGKKTNQYTYEIGDILKGLNFGELLVINQLRNLNGYKSYKYQCLVCNNRDIISEYSLKRKSGCNVCCGRKVREGYNDLHTTHPNIAKLLLNYEDGHKYSHGSNELVKFKCEECGHIKLKAINKVVLEGISCPQCSDGISYPEKFMFNFLCQLNIKFETQSSFEWSKNICHPNKKLSGNKRYDFYLPFQNSIIEVHGGHHYVESNYKSVGGKTLKEEQENDKLKEYLATSNQIKNYIVINCRVSEMVYIKDNIINSEINKLFDLSAIDWNKCHEFACSNLVKKTCSIWNKGLKSVEKISKELKISKSSVTRYLNKGATIGLCDYDGKTIKDSLKKKVVKLSLDGCFIREYKSISEAANLEGISVNAISVVCRGVNKYAYGYRWMYKKDYENQQSYIKPIKAKGNPVVRLTLSGEYIDEWASISAAAKTLDCYIGHISRVCKGIYKKHKGYKWMYKEDYEKYLEDQKQLVSQ